ncbi:hypothetical protein CEXT_154341 [Caerostris extrusa]|uniref:Uncharacterized protein n=1 Tax=Caerostris extrusa TaxID=172846 RepID=A0AAV4XGV0_CAEEX|nr:hypothetical protein CEXT_154341 [Caerostris extrusa]
MADLKPLQGQELFTYGTNNLCDFQVIPSSQSVHTKLQSSPSSDEVLQVLEPIPHVSMVNGGLQLDNLYKYRPEDSISSVVNTALALNDDLFSSDGSSSDLPTELDLVSPDHLDMGGPSTQAIPATTDWWGFQHPSLDGTLTPLLSISVPSQPSVCNTFSNSYAQGTPYVLDRQTQDPLQNQPWAECKAALEAVAFDLDDLGDLDPVHVY